MVPSGVAELVKDIWPGGSSDPGILADVNGTLFFTADDGVRGRELWKSDGTEAGTVLVKDLLPGSASSPLSNLTNVNGTLYFTFDDGVHGRELWRSDGTEAGTVLVSDIFSGPNGSEPGGLTNVNGTLFFTADDGVHGRELWRVRFPFAYGAPGWVPLVGDWDGDGIATVGAFDPATATFYLRNSNSRGIPDIAPFQFGAPGWVPVVGDWDGDGITTIGVFDPTGQFGQAPATWFLRNSNGPGAPDLGPFAYGAAGWVPVVGDWDGDGTTTIGAFDPFGQYGQPVATWYLRNSNGPGAPDLAPFQYGAAGWIPVVGDWDGDGTTTVGVFDPVGQFGRPPATWFLSNSNIPGAPDVEPFAYGAPGWIPVVGDWDGDGLTDAGVFDPFGQYGQQPATWYLMPPR
ncbi:MAG: hypothetical protein L0Z62_22275 [Gemmataceae bacterium]|nr:hypothetical protein [Gemmataceae bacterium]